MELKKISFFDEFQCLAGDCPETCCHGWIIPLEEDDLTRFRAQKGFLGLRLLMAMTPQGESACLNASSATCPFQKRSGLCSLQLRMGHSYLPEACRMYPRFYRNYGPFEEQYIDLSCIAGARLFVHNADAFFLTGTDGKAVCSSLPEDFLLQFSGKPLNCNDFFSHTSDEYGDADSSGTEYNRFPAEDKLKLSADRVSDPSAAPECEAQTAPCTTNDDLHFLDALLLSRAERIAALSTVQGFSGLQKVLTCLDAYAAATQEAYLRGAEDFLRTQPFSSFNITRDTPSVFPLPIELLDRMLHTSLYNRRLKKTNPRLYRLFRLYFVRYYRLLHKSDGWDTLSRGFFSRYPDFVRYFAAYFRYYLYQYDLKSFEDYSFVRNLRLGLTHLNLLFLFTCLYEKKHGSLTTENFAHILAVYNRRAYFNDNVLDELYRVWEDFPKLNGKRPVG